MAIKNKYGKNVDVAQELEQATTIQVTQSPDSAQIDQGNEVSLDILGLFKYWLSKWFVILAIMVIGAGAGAAYQKLFIGELYRADTSIFVADSDTVVSISDLSLSSALSVDYQKILLSRTTLKRIIKDLNLQMNFNQLRNLLTITQDESSHIVTVSVTTSDPDLSRVIANSMTTVGIERIQDIITAGDATLVDPASSDAIVNVTPPISRYIIMGALVGMLFPLVIMFIIFILDSTYKGEDEMVERLKSPVLSAVPYYGRKNMVKAELGYFEKEAFNTLYGNISLSGADKKLIALTSASPNEGKSSLSFKLAESMTGFNKTVVYVDCDMRNSSFCQLYGIDKSINPGLSGFLSGNAEIGNVMIKDANNPNLYVIPAGKNPPNPSALISGERFIELINLLKNRCDYIIFDTPPVNAVIDGIFVAKECDGTILVVESAVTERRMAEKAMDSLRAANVEVLGVVVNKVGKSRNTYGYGGYGYGKKKGYGYGTGGYGKKYGYGYGYGKIDKH